MRLRVKLYFVAVGYQCAAAMLFAVMGRIGYAMMAVFFAVTAWYGGNYWVEEEIKNALTKE